MALFKRCDSNFYRLEYTYAGRRHRVSTGAERMPAARELERTYRQKAYEELVLGRRRHEPMRFEDAVRRFASTHLVTKARLPKSAQCSNYILVKLTKLVGPDTTLDEITTERVANLKETLFDNGKRKPATVNYYLAMLRAILRMAQREWKRVGEVPLFKLYALKNERTRWLRPEEEVRLLKACDDAPHLRDLVTFLVDSGTRLGEACALTWDKVLLPSRGKGTASIFATKTQTPRTIPLTARADALLRRLHADRPDDQDRVFLIRTPGGNWRGTTFQAKPFHNPHGAWNTAVKKASSCPPVSGAAQRGRSHPRPNDQPLVRR
jgi:integrase